VPQEGEDQPSIAEILRAGRWPGRAGGQDSPSETVADAQPRTMAEIVRRRRQIRLAREAGASGECGRVAEQSQ
jgi:hypothetical protein